MIINSIKQVKMLKDNFGNFSFQHKRNLNYSLLGVEFKFYIIMDIKF